MTAGAGRPRGAKPHTDRREPDETTLFLLPVPNPAGGRPVPQAARGLLAVERPAGHRGRRGAGAGLPAAGHGAVQRAGPPAGLHLPPCPATAEPAAPAAAGGPAVRRHRAGVAGLPAGLPSGAGAVPGELLQAGLPGRSGDRLRPADLGGGGEDGGAVQAVFLQQGGVGPAVRRRERRGAGPVCPGQAPGPRPGGTGRRGGGVLRRADPGVCQRQRVQQKHQHGAH